MPPRRGPQAEVEAENSEVNPTQQLVDILLGVLQGHPIGQPNENTPKTTIFKDFKSVGPPEFRGTAKPIEAQGWITEIEKVFTITNVGEDQKTVFATFFLKGEANYWWEANRTRAGVGIVTWDRFKELFFENFFPQSMQDRMEVQFLELRQGELTVSQYTAKFNELARFAPHQVDSEARKTRRYEEGLKPQIRSKLSVFQVKTFPEILEKAIIAENENEALIKFHKDKSNQNEGGRFKGEAITGGFNNNKRKWDTTFANNYGKRGNNYNDNKNNNKRIDPCVTCGKNHRGVCFNKRITCHSCGQEGHYAFQCPNSNRNRCFNCGSMDHMARTCPKPRNQNGGGNRTTNNNPKPTVAGAGGQNRPTARTFNMTVRDAIASQDVVTGIIPIDTLNAYVLFDSGATCSFVSNSFAKNLNMPCENLDIPFSVEIANKEVIPVKTIYKNCNVEIKGHKFLVNLIPIQLGEFDVILGMDWLVNHNAMIDCHRKHVNLLTTSKSKVVFNGSCSPKQSRCLTVMQAKRLLRKGGTGYLAYIVDTRKEGVKLDQIPVVREFQDVFPDDLPGLPPDREIEFVIDLAPGTEPVSKAPYRMAPVELKELLVQLQELLDKKYIQPSVSPWEHLCCL